MPDPRTPTPEALERVKGVIDRDNIFDLCDEPECGCQEAADHYIESIALALDEWGDKRWREGAEACAKAMDAEAAKAAKELRRVRKSVIAPLEGEEVALDTARLENEASADACRRIAHEGPKDG